MLFIRLVPCLTNPRVWLDKTYACNDYQTESDITRVSVAGVYTHSILACKVKGTCGRKLPGSHSQVSGIINEPLKYE